MNKFLVLILIATSTLISATSCSKSEEQKITLIGQWELNEICFSDGASRCDEGEIKAPDFKETMTFSSDGSVVIIRDGSECIGSFTYDNKEELIMKADDANCNFDNAIFRVFDLTTNSVTINPPCREACVKRYVRI